MTNTYNEKEYLIYKYNEDDYTDCWFDPRLNTNFSYIPKCSSCEENFKSFKNNLNDNEDFKEIKWNHPQGCLWHDFYILKIKNLKPKIKIEYK